VKHAAMLELRQIKYAKGLIADVLPLPKIEPVCEGEEDDESFRRYGLNIPEPECVGSFPDNIVSPRILSTSSSACSATRATNMLSENNYLFHDRFIPPIRNALVYESAPRTILNPVFPEYQRHDCPTSHQNLQIGESQNAPVELTKNVFIPDFHEYRRHDRFNTSHENLQIVESQESPVEEPPGTIFNPDFPEYRRLDRSASHRNLQIVESQESPDEPPGTIYNPDFSEYQRHDRLTSHQNLQLIESQEPLVDVNCSGVSLETPSRQYSYPTCLDTFSSPEIEQPLHYAVPPNSVTEPYQKSSPDRTQVTLKSEALAVDVTGTLLCSSSLSDAPPKLDYDDVIRLIGESFKDLAPILLRVFCLMFSLYFRIFIKTFNVCFYLNKNRLKGSTYLNE